MPTGGKKGLVLNVKNTHTRAPVMNAAVAANVSTTTIHLRVPFYYEITAAAMCTAVYCSGWALAEYRRSPRYYFW